MLVDPSAWDTIAEERIRAAQEEGLFDDLPGFGQPISDVDRRDPNWWIKRKLKAEQISVLPPILEVKLARERTLERLHELTSERAVRERIEALNVRIGRALLSASADVPIALSCVDVDAAVNEWRRRRGSP